MTAPPSTHRAFGLSVRCHFPLPELPSTPTDAVDVDLALVGPDEVDERFSGSCDPPAMHIGSVGGTGRYRTERGIEADHRIDFVGHATFHISADGRTLGCAPRDRDDPAWRRFLLDTVLSTTALACGHEAFHAAAFSVDGRAVAIAGDEGSGKSTLLATALLRGAGFVCDDVLCITHDPVTDVFSVHASPPVVNLPAVLPDGTRADRLGRVLATFGEEQWVAVAPVAVDSCSLLAFVVLDRSGDRLDVDRLEPSPRALLRHSLTSGRTPDRLRHRFDLCANLASKVVTFRVSAAPADPAADVLDALEEALAPAPRS